MMVTADRVSELRPCVQETVSSGFLRSQSWPLPLCGGGQFSPEHSWATGGRRPGDGQSRGQRGEKEK